MATFDTAFDTMVERAVVAIVLLWLMLLVLLVLRTWRLTQAPMRKSITVDRLEHKARDGITVTVTFIVPANYADVPEDVAEPLLRSAALKSTGQIICVYHDEIVRWRASRPEMRSKTR